MQTVYRLTLSNGDVRYYYVRGIAELYANLHGGFVDEIPLTLDIARSLRDGVDALSA